jgi:hypothetical protein
LPHKFGLLLQTDFFRLRMVEMLVFQTCVIRNSNDTTRLVASNSWTQAPGVTISLGIAAVIFLPTIILFSGLIPLGVVNLTNSFFLEISPVNGLGIIIRNTRCFRSASY